jgi:hypothetical protein
VNGNDQDVERQAAKRNKRLSQVHLLKLAFNHVPLLYQVVCLLTAFLSKSIQHRPLTFLTQSNCKEAQLEVYCHEWR